MVDFTRPRITEKRYLAITATVLLADGTVDGVITIVNTYAFKVGQIVLFKQGGTNFLAKVQQVLSETQFIVIDKDKAITTHDKLDMSSWLAGSTVELKESKRPVIDLLEIQRQVYEEEPTVALRTHAVDWLGRSFDSSNPMPVQLSDGSINIGSVNAELEVQLSHKDNVPNLGDVADSTQVGDGVEILQINPDGSITVALGGVTGTLKVHREAGAITDMTETTVAIMAATVNNTALMKVKGDAQTMGTWRMYKNTIAPANLLNVTKTSLEDRNAMMVFAQPELFQNGDNVIITFQADRYRSEFIGASSPTFVKIEGFTP